MYSRKKLLIAASILTLPLVSADAVWSAVRSPHPVGPAPAGTKVAVVGDSISNLTTPELKRRFQDRRFVAPVVSGINGARSDERRIDAAPLLDHDPPEVLVVELGTNDLGRFGGQHPDATADDRRRFADDVTANERSLADRPSVRCVVVVTVTTSLLSVSADETAVAINDGFRRWAATDRRVRVADWDALLRDEYRDGEPRGSMTIDLVHPTPYGTARLAELVDTTIDRCPV